MYVVKLEIKKEQLKDWYKSWKLKATGAGLDSTR